MSYPGCSLSRYWLGHRTADAGLRGQLIDLRHMANDWREECLKVEARLAALQTQLEQLPRYMIDPTWGLSDPEPDGDLLKRDGVLSVIRSLGEPK